MGLRLLQMSVHSEHIEDKELDVLRHLNPDSQAAVEQVFPQ